MVVVAGEIVGKECFIEEEFVIVFDFKVKEC